MKITLKQLKSKWNAARIEKIKNFGFIITSPEFLKANKDEKWLEIIDAVWGNEHGELVEQRNAIAEASHIFVSQICDIAADEYLQVQKLIKFKNIFLLSFENDEKFFEQSLLMLKPYFKSVDVIKKA